MVQFDKFQRILLIRLSSLGDILLMTPVLRLLREACPQAKIDVLVKPEYQGALAAHPEIDRLLTISDPPFWQTVKTLRSELYDVAMDLHGKPLTRLLLGVSRSRYKLACRSQNFKKDLLIHLGWNTFQGGTPVPELYAAPLRDLGLTEVLPGS